LLASPTHRYCRREKPAIAGARSPALQRLSLMALRSTTRWVDSAESILSLEQAAVVSDNLGERYDVGAKLTITLKVMTGEYVIGAAVKTAARSEGHAVLLRRAYRLLLERPELFPPDSISYKWGRAAVGDDGAHLHSQRLRPGSQQHARRRLVPSRPPRRRRPLRERLQRSQLQSRLRRKQWCQVRSQGR
jgi:hypothetical protein